jgi:hypothetical protein
MPRVRLARAAEPARIDGGARFLMGGHHAITCSVDVCMGVLDSNEDSASFFNSSPHGGIPQATPTIGYIIL